MSVFDLIKSRVSILDVARDYSTLKKAGSYWKGSCPFHSEKTGSFTVSPHRQIYYCFGCHAGGDVIDFVSRAERCSQHDAVRHLAERYAIDISAMVAPRERYEAKSQEREQYFKACAFFARWCQDHLARNTAARDYLAKRSISAESITRFQIGYCPTGNYARELIERASEVHLMRGDLIAAHILAENKHGVYLPFEDRIIFPIQTASGQMCGFGGRVYAEQDHRPKYYNSHEHPLFEKGHILFGLHLARKTVQEAGVTYLVEGYTDCIAMAQAGIQNTVATLGTACTREHLITLARYASQLHVVYDGDSAGQQAIERLIAIAWDVDLDVCIVTLPPGEDPASLIAKGQDLSKYLNNRSDVFSWILQRYGAQFHHKTMTERTLLLRSLTTHLAAVRDPLKRSLLLQQAAQTFDIPATSLKQQMAHAQSGHYESRKTEEQALQPHDPFEEFGREIGILEKKVLYGILSDRDFLDEMEFSLVTDDLPPALGALVHDLRAARQANLSLDETAFMAARTPEERLWVANLLLDERVSCGKDDYEDLVGQILKKQWKRILNDVKMKLSATSSAVDRTHAEGILAALNKRKELMVRKGLI